MKIGASIIAVVVGSLVLAACGDDDKKAAPKGPLSKAAFIAQGDAICVRSDAAFNKLFDTDFPVLESATDEFFAKAMPILRDQVAGLRALDEPVADKAPIDKMLARGDRAVADFERAGSDAPYGAKLFTDEGGRNIHAFEKHARAYGFKKCGSEDENSAERKPDRSAFSAEKKAYIAKADAICRPGNAKSAKLERRYLSKFPPEIGAWAKFLPAIVDVVRPQVADLEQLSPPAADKKRIDGLLARQKDVIELYDAAGKAAATGDEAAFLKVGRPMFNESDRLDADIRAYGFRQCGTES